MADELGPHLVNNCYRDYSVRGAAGLRDLLARYTGSEH
jgi:hypothetical protein